MKKLLPFCFIFFFAFSFSQTQIKKWNSTLKRYEYFDSKGNLKAYEEYNRFLQQWEYFDSQHKNKYENYNNSIDDFYTGLNSDQDQTIANLESLRRQSQYDNSKLRNYVIQLQNEARNYAEKGNEANKNENYHAAAEYAMKAFYKMTTIQMYVNNKKDVQFYRINYLYSAGENYELEGNHKKAISVFEKFNEIFEIREVDDIIRKAYHKTFSIALYNDNQTDRALTILYRESNFSNDTSLLNLKNLMLEEHSSDKTLSEKLTEALATSNTKKSPPKKVANPIKKGDVIEVFTNSPIFEEPDSSSKSVGMAKNNKVTIIEKASNGNFYKIKTGEIVGYIWEEWFKK